MTFPPSPQVRSNGNKSLFLGKRHGFGFLGAAHPESAGGQNSGPGKARPSFRFYRLFLDLVRDGAALCEGTKQCYMTLYKMACNARIL